MLVFHMLYRITQVFKSTQNWVGVSDGSRTDNENELVPQARTRNSKTSLAISRCSGAWHYKVTTCRETEVSMINQFRHWWAPDIWSLVTLSAKKLKLISQKPKVMTNGQTIRQCHNIIHFILKWAYKATETRVSIPAMWSIDERVDSSSKTQRIQQIGQFAHCLPTDTMWQLSIICTPSDNRLTATTGILCYRYR